MNLSLFFRVYEMKEIIVHSRYLTGFIYEVNATQEGTIHRDHVISPSQSRMSRGHPDSDSISPMETLFFHVTNM